MLAAVALPVLIVAAVIAWRRESWDLTNLDVSLRLCTYIAACAVVGARLAEHRVVLWVLAAMALQVWLSLAPVWCAAIATLAGDHIDKAGLDSVWPVTVVTWFVATVFPLGMYSSATYATAVETGWHWLTMVSLAFFWIAFAAWLVTALHSLVRIGSPRAPAAGTPSGPTR